MKKVLSFMFILAMALAPQSVCAEWDEEDVIIANIISNGDFETCANADAFYGGTVDTDTFKNEEHKNVLAITGTYCKLQDSDNKLSNLIEDGEKITISFDFYPTVADKSLRLELRGIASGELTKQKQDTYWSGFSYGQIYNVGSWNHIEATIDVPSLKTYYTEQDALKSEFDIAYFYFDCGSSDVYIDNIVIKKEGSENVIIPLQTPKVTYNSDFTKIDDMISADGENITNVYKGVVDVSSQNKTSEILSSSDYTFNEGTYTLSFWFMEDEDNADTMTRMWRPYTESGEEIKPQAGQGYNGANYLYYSKTADLNTLGHWIYLEMSFDVTKENNYKSLLENGNVTLKWNCVDNNGGYPKNLPENITDYSHYIYIGDFRIYKVPTNNETEFEESFFSGESVSEQQAKIIFSLPISESSIKAENIKINGTEQKNDSICFSLGDDGRTVAINRPNGIGFAPATDFTVSISGLKDIWNRALEETTISFTTEDYSEPVILNYLDSDDVETEALSSAKKIKFNLTNNYKDNLPLRIVVVGYYDKAVKKVYSSENIIIPCNDNEDAIVNVDGGFEGCNRIMVFTWSIADNGAVSAFSKPLTIEM